MQLFKWRKLSFFMSNLRRKLTLPLNLLGWYKFQKDPIYNPQYKFSSIICSAPKQEEPAK